MNKDRIRGLFLGTAIGDCLGMPVETFPAAKVAETYGRVTTYLVPDGHKWFNGHKAGTYTDDTQLTLAVAEGLIESPLDMDAQAKSHVAALKETTAGWGNTTRNAVRRVANGAHWNISGSGGDGSGTGNGVAMKISPVGVYLSTIKNKRTELAKGIEFINGLNSMTHKTSVAASAALAHAFAVYNCCCCESPEKFTIEKFSKVVVTASRLGRDIFTDTLDADDLSDRLEFLFENLSDYEYQNLIDDFGGGSCYVFNSLPFTYGFFLKNPHSIDSVYDVVSAGGDADSNGSMVGGLLGCLHGTSIFPKQLIDGLVEKDRILGVADRFAEKFGFV